MSLLEASPAVPETNPPSPQSLPDIAALASAAKCKRRIPSERNRRVYEQVVLRERPQNEVAKEFKITQQRVSQIVDHFHAWLTENLPPEAEEYNAQEQLTLAASHAYLRQEYLFAEAMRRLDQSGKVKVVEKTRYSKSGEVLGTHATRRPGSPNSGFMNAALKATLQQWKLGQMAHGLLGRAMEIQFWLPHEYEDQSLCRAEPADGSPPPVLQRLQLPRPQRFAIRRRPQIRRHKGAKRKSCELPPESHKPQTPKVLWAADRPPSPEATAARQEAVSTPAPATTCDRGTQAVQQTQGSLNPCAKSCETPDVMTEALITDDEWAAWLSSAADRNARKKERQKQLAR
jgi:hypothetical protein